MHGHQARTRLIAPGRSGRLPVTRCLGFLVLTLLTLLTGAAPASAQEGGIEVFAAETLFASGTRVSISHIYKRNGTRFDGTSEVSDPLHRTFTEQRLVASIDHGLRPDLTLSLLAPYVHKSLDSSAGDLGGEGFGDVALLAKWRMHKRDWKRGAVHLSLVGGVELPTGETGVRDNGMRLPVSLQPGSGSWDPFVAIAGTLDLNRYRFDALAFYKLNSEGAQSYDQGDFTSFDLKGAYRFLHTKYPGPTASAKLGLQWRHEGRAEQRGSIVAGTGSDELRVRTGLTWHPAPEWDLSLSVEVPLHQDFVDQQLGLDYRTFLALGIRF